MPFPSTVVLAPTRILFISGVNAEELNREFELEEVVKGPTFSAANSSRMFDAPLEGACICPGKGNGLGREEAVGVTEHDDDEDESVEA